MFVLRPLCNHKHKQELQANYNAWLVFFISAARFSLFVYASISLMRMKNNCIDRLFLLLLDCKNSDRAFMHC